MKTGDRVVDRETGMAGTIIHRYHIGKDPIVEIQWDPSTMVEVEVDYEFKAPDEPTVA
jgi:hypothetical protein